MKICELDYLKSHAPNNPKFVEEMIQMFLKETPAYLAGIKKSLAASDWEDVHVNAHKIKPSINFLGLPADIADAIKLINEYATTQQHLDLIPNLFLKVETAMQLAYIELADELKNQEAKGTK